MSWPSLSRNSEVLYVATRMVEMDAIAPPVSAARTTAVASDRRRIRFIIISVGRKNTPGGAGGSFMSCKNGRVRIIVVVYAMDRRRLWAKKARRASHRFV